VTSGCRLPRLGQNIGYATLPIERGERLGQESAVRTATAASPRQAIIDPGKQIPGRTGRPGGAVLAAQRQAGDTRVHPLPTVPAGGGMTDRPGGAVE